jgi:glycosyltransferase involved in cell wall biosynthesis
MVLPCTRGRHFMMQGDIKKKKTQPEDYDLFRRIVKAGWGAKRVPDPILEYRQHSREQTNIKLNSFIELIHYKEQVKRLQDAIREKDAEKVALVKQLNQTISEKDNIWNQLNAIYSGDFWKVASFYYKLRDRIPLTIYLHRTLGCLRRERFKATLGKIKNKIRNEGFEKVQGTGITTEKTTGQIINTPEYETNPYANIKLLKDIQVSVLNADFDAGKISTPFSLVTTIKNESTGIVDFLRSIESQSLRPNEVIIVDGGSTDKTAELVEVYKGQSSLKIKFIKSSPINIALGRNIGIKEASNEILVLTDAGCRLDKNFCLNLVGCFSYPGNIDLAGGIYKLMHESPIFSIDWQSLNWQEFIPSARSITIKKSLALRAGGFPEFLTLTGEDTLFDINYRRISSRWVFNRKSVIYWDSPKTDDEAYKVAYTYGRGDGENGLGDWRFHETFYNQLKLFSSGQKIDIRDPFRRGLFLGYLEGRKNRSYIEIDKRNITGVVLILSEAPFANSGDENTRIVLDLISGGYKVIFVSVNHPSSKDNRVWFDTDYTLLELYYAHDFNWEEFIERYRRIQEKTFVLYKFYHPVLASIVEKLKAKTGNKIKVISESPAMHEDMSLVKRKSSLEEGNTFKDRTNSGHADETLQLTPKGPKGDNSNSHVYGAYDSDFVRRSAVNMMPINRNLAFTALGDTLHRLMSSVKNHKFMLNFLKFRYYSQNYGLKEALRRSYHKLKKAVVKDQQKTRQDMIIKSDERSESTLFQTKNGRSFDIISFPIMPWFSRFQRSQQLLTKFAANGTRVFRIDRGFLLDNKTRYIPEKVHENILHVTLNSGRAFNIYTDFIDDESLNRMLRSFNNLRMDYMISNAVCILELPFWYPLAKNLKERYGWEIVYDCMDEHEGFSTNKNQMFSVESKLAMESSLIVVTSNYLYEKMARYNRNCVLIPNATNFEHFHHLPENDLLTDVKKPIIGYYGALSEWFDAELIEHAAKTKKDWNFILIGGNDSGINLSALKKLPNVRLLGEKPYSELPKYLYWFDVCLIPFKLSKLTEATNPVKFYEYMSSGKPVVSVRLPELFPVADYLYLANDKEDFIRKIEAALEENYSELRERRVAFAKENTWEKRSKLKARH